MKKYPGVGGNVAQERFWTSKTFKNLLIIYLKRNQKHTNEVPLDIHMVHTDSGGKSSSEICCCLSAQTV